MKLNISDWESFCASDIFFLYNGSGITKEEIEDNPGSFPAVQSGADNNGCIGYISKDLHLCRRTLPYRCKDWFCRVCCFSAIWLRRGRFSKDSFTKKY